MYPIINVVQDERHVAILNFKRKLHQKFELLHEMWHQNFNYYLTFDRMKMKNSKFNWKQLVEIILIIAIVGLLIFVILFIL